MGIFQQIGRWWNNLFPKKDIETALDLQVITSLEMLQAQDLWRSTYMGQAPWNVETDNKGNIKYPSRHLAATVCSELAMVTTVEVNPMFSGYKTTADYIEAQFKPFFTEFKLIAEKANYNGTLAIDPAPNGANIDINIFETNEFRIVRVNNKKDIVGIVFIYGINRDEKFYTLFKHCEYYDETQEYSIEHRAFVSDKLGAVGKEIPLTDVPEWAKLPPTITYYQMTGPWFCVYRAPLNNHIDQQAAEGVSIFSRAMQDIEDLDKHKAQTRWEYKSGERAVFAPDGMWRDVGKKDALNPRNGEVRLAMPDGAERLYINTGIDSHEMTKPETYSPEFRDVNLHSGDDRLKRDLELAISFSYGIISDPSSVAKTATEVTSSQERYWQTVSSHQNAWDRLLKEQLLPSVQDISWRYGLVRQGEVELNIDWDDSIIVNQTEQQAEVKGEIGALVSLQNAGVIEPAQTRAVALKNLKYLKMITDEDVAEAKAGLPGAFDDDNDGAAM